MSNGKPDSGSVPSRSTTWRLDRIDKDVDELKDSIRTSMTEVRSSITKLQTDLSKMALETNRSLGKVEARLDSLVESNRPGTAAAGTGAFQTTQQSDAWKAVIDFLRLVGVITAVVVGALTAVLGGGVLLKNLPQILGQMGGG